MSRLCCISCNGLSLTLGGREHTVRDSTGRIWRFEQHPYCGPIILRNNGNPKSRQPGSRSAFWPAYEVWRASQSVEAAQHVDAEGAGQELSSCP